MGLDDPRILVVAAVMLATWLGVLTVVMLILLREVAIHGVRLEQTGNQRMPEGADGIEIGNDLPQAFLEAVPEAGQPIAYVLLMSAICAPCRELAPQLAKLRMHEPVVALVPGRPEAAESLVSMLPAYIRTISDPDATSLAAMLRITATPFVVQAEHGKVTGKAMARSSAELMNLVDARRSAGRSPLLQIRGVTTHAD